MSFFRSGSFALFLFFCCFFILLFWFFIFSCEKRINPVIFWQFDLYYQERFFSHSTSEKDFFSTNKGEIMVVSFPSYQRTCLVKLYPSSSIYVRRVSAHFGKVNIYLDSVSGNVLVISSGCNFYINDVFLEEGILRVLSDGEKIRIEVLEGSAKIFDFNIKKGQGYVLEEDKIYMIPKEVSLVFPKDGVDVTIPLFLWEKVQEAKSYFLEISLDQDFLNPIFFFEIKENRFFPDSFTLFRFSGSFFWRVWYETEDGRFSFFSETRKIRIPSF
jgi:hypothetical protein